MNDEKEKERRKKISSTLKIYFNSAQGKQHREMLSNKQRERMRNLYKIYKTNNQLNNNKYDKKI